ncbi:hypothetical protein NA57DRAFT_68922 [Rhizodiscina lignyota]|uniref:Zn(2)-C6 fungal-type domain-containing protein n=1 Tax=Rhizodiscina lignyota TaxID=1504668 RepID=A0A9P4M5J5_9PEZI|nr:hypothetical protein NA57DRAFT_68922 [Rhizodiscina lignyota]
MRNRPQLSCTPCRQRKLKCDRGRPCENCVKREELDTCIYPRYAKRSLRTPDKAKERINKLENLFMELSKGNDNFPSSDKLNTGDESLVRDQRSMNGSEISPRSLCTDTSNSTTPLKWKDILEDITEIKEYFEGHELDLKQDVDKLQTTKSDLQLADLLCGIHCKQDVSLLIAGLPERPLVDRLVANYFDYSFMFRPVIHPKQFQREYSRFWKSPSTVSKVWLGLLFAMIRLSAETLRNVSSNASPELLLSDETISIFRTCAVQCLALEDYTNGNIHGLQGLLTHLESEYMRSLDSQANLWILTGTTVRIALMNGLHRDPSHYANLSPFESEMRRRLWMGLPAMIPTAQTDTSLPRNLREDDFDEDMGGLPPSRPIDDATTISFYLVKAPLVEVFGRVASHLQTVHMSDELMKTLDAELQAAWDGVPAYYRVRPIDESLIDPAQIHLTAVCILHRKGLVLARSHEQFNWSRKASVRHRETQPGGRLSGLRSMMMSITKNDYLLAAMLVCLDVHLTVAQPSSICTDLAIWGWDRTEEMLKALETSYYIWKEYSQESAEAFKASEALAAMLEKLRPEFVPTGTTIESGNGDNTSYGADMPLSQMFVEPESIDWDELDRYFINCSPPVNSWMNPTDMT